MSRIFTLLWNRSLELSHLIQLKLDTHEVTASRPTAQRPWHPPFCLLSLWIWLLRTSCKCKHPVFVFWWLTYFTERNVLKVHLCYVLSHSVVSDSLQPDGHGLQPTRLLCPWDSLGKNTGVGCRTLLQGSFPTQGSNLGLPHCRWIFYYLSYQGSPTCVITWWFLPFNLILINALILIYSSSSNPEILLLGTCSKKIFINKAKDT